MFNPGRDNKLEDVTIKKIRVHSKSKKKILGFMGVSLSLVGVLVLTGTVWWAYWFNNGSFAITIMHFNEGLLEFVLMPFLLLICCYGVYRYYKDVLCGGVAL